MQDGGEVGVEGWVRNKAECISPAMEPQRVERTEGGWGVKCYKCNAGGEYKCAHIVCHLFRSVGLCEFDGSGVCSEPLLTSAAVARLVQQGRHSPSMEGCVRGRGGSGFHTTERNQGTNEHLPRKPERCQIILFNSVLRGEVRDSESLN